MRGLMMRYELTIPAILRRAETFSPAVEIVSRGADLRVHRYSYADMIRRAKRLAVALRTLGVGAGARVATLGWNHHRHLEAYFAIPSIGAVLHTLNLRLHPDELAYIAGHAGDRVLIADWDLLPLVDDLCRRVAFEHVVIMASNGAVPNGMADYETLIAQADADAFTAPDVDEDAAAAMCYTSGTTGRPKGVVYSHRAIVLSAMNWMMADSVGVRARDVILAVPSMFHINGWNFPFIAALAGAKLVLPGRQLDAASVLDLIARERVTLSGGVPTVWLGVLQALENGAAQDVSSLRLIASGGAAVPPTLMRGWQERHVEVLHIWGMTEMTAVGTVSRCPLELDGAPNEARQAWLAKQGVPTQLVEMRARAADGLVPWDGRTMGEIEVRGPMVARAYYDSAESAARFTDDGWLRTGDIATIDPRGCMEIRDRSKDLIKSGGEWISSLALERALMAHPAVAEAAVVAVRHAKWGERPLAVVVLRRDCTVTSDELRQFLEPSFPRWMLPDACEFVDEIPRTSTGKFLKSALRERYRDYYTGARVERA